MAPLIRIDCGGVGVAAAEIMNAGGESWGVINEEDGWEGVKKKSGGWKSEDVEERELKQNSQPRTPTNCHHEDHQPPSKLPELLEDIDLPQGLSQGIPEEKSVKKEEEEQEEEVTPILGKKADFD